MTVLANVNVTRPNVSGILLANQPVQVDGHIYGLSRGREEE